MRTFSKEEVLMGQEGVKQRIFDGEIFIYPTDTIYGIGCNALMEKSVDKIREIKDRHTAPFSIIVPNKKWIYKYCIVNEKAEEWIKKLPGPYTLIFKLKDMKSISPSVNMGKGTIGVRMPKHWISGLVAELDIPIVTTSANKAGRRFMTSMEDLSSEIKQYIPFAIIEGEIKGKPSTLVHLDLEDIKIKER